MHLSFGQLEAFVAVVERGGITPAADQLNWSKSKVSKLLSELENNLNVRLFYRSTRGLKATHEGLQFYNETKKNLTSFEASVDRITESRDQVKGHLKVAAPLIFARSILTPAIQALADENVTLDISLSDEKSDLDERAYDVYIRIGPLEEGDYYAKKLGETELMYVASPEFVARYPEGLTAEHLTHLDLLRYGHHGEAMPFYIAGEPVDSNPVAKLVSNNGEYLAEAAMAGLGVAWLPDFIVYPFVAQGRLVHLTLDPQPLRVPIHLLYFERAMQTQVLSRFIQVVTDQVRERCPNGCSNAFLPAPTEKGAEAPALD